MQKEYMGYKSIPIQYEVPENDTIQYFWAEDI